MKKEIVVSLADLRYVAIQCPNCKTQVVLDMKETTELAKKHGAFTPKDCPGCHQPYDTAIRPSVDAFQNAYHALLDIAERVNFRGDAESLG